MARTHIAWHTGPLAPTSQAEKLAAGKPPQEGPHPFVSGLIERWEIHMMNRTHARYEPSPAETLSNPCNQVQQMHALAGPKFQKSI